MCVDPINMPRAVSEADGVIGYGSPGLLLEVLHFGKPALMFPINGDQVICTARAARAGRVTVAPPGVVLDSMPLVRDWLAGCVSGVPAI